jgi:integrase/recombinase XerD
LSARPFEKKSLPCCVSEVPVGCKAFLSVQFQNPASPFGGKEQRVSMNLQQASSEFLSGYFSTNDRRDKTRTAYTHDIEQFQEFAGIDLPLASLNGEVIERWALRLRQEGYAPASMRRKMAVLKVFSSYWVRKGALLESPFWRVKLSFGRVVQLPRSLTESETRALLAQTRNWQSVAHPMRRQFTEDEEATFSRQYRAIRNLALVDLLFATGMRVGEVSALDFCDFAVDDAFFRVKGKGGRNRLAFAVDTNTLRIQRGHLEARLRITADSPALFLNARGGRLSTQGISKVLAQIREDAKIERHVTPHMLRHTVATLLLRNGADIRVVQEFLGHSSIATTQRYTHVSKEHLVGVLRKHHPSLSFRQAESA